jgi:hypothetical protein
MTIVRSEDSGARTPRADDGVAMILVMAWGLLMMGLVLVVSQAVVNQIVPSDRSEHSYAALGAAEAGLADIEARLQVGTIMSVKQDATNLALKGWVPVPGGNTDGEFTYAIDATKSGAVGEVRAYAMGRSGDVTRTVESVLSKRSTLDYVYMSDIETPSPDTPGVYSTAQYGTSGMTYQEVARILCDRRWVEPGPLTVSSSGTVTDGAQRNLRYCRWAGIFSSERLIGKLHTNDIWWLENVNLSSTLQAGAITSSCRTANEGLVPGESGCPVGHRFIATNTSGVGTTTNASLSQAMPWTIPGANSTQRDPLYDTVLDLPANPDLLKQRAAESGCIFTGPTRIRFSEEGGVGYMYVTSPDTKLTRAGCDGSDGTTLQSAATSQVTKKVPLTDLTDLVIYVQDVRPSTETDTPGADYNDPLQKYYWEKQNRWVSGNEPTCTLKAGRKYPYVIPNDTTDQSYFNNGVVTYKGFPSEQADPNSPWYGSACASGDLYVQGAYKGAIMLTSDNNVILTSSLRDSSLANPSAAVGATDYGKPNPQSQSVLGIAASRFAYTDRPIKADESWVGDWKTTSNASNVIYNFALLAIQHCFGSQNYDKSINNGNIYLWGSLAQKFRCAVGISGNSGYGKVYKYDDRLTIRTPPYMLELSDEPWGDDRTGEMTVERQALSTPTTWELLRPEDVTAGAQIKNVKLASTPDPTKVTMASAGSQVTLTSTVTGLVVVTYEVATTTTRDVRRLVVLVE